MYIFSAVYGAFSQVMHSVDGRCYAVDQNAEVIRVDRCGLMRLVLAYCILVKHSSFHNENNGRPRITALFVLPEGA